MSGLCSIQGRATGGVPTLPLGASMGLTTRLWLDGVLADLFRPRVGGCADGSDYPAESSVRIARARPKVVLLWASQTGNIESLTERYATQLMESGFEIRTTCMADYAVSDLAKAQYVLLMTSIFGDGDAPRQRPGFLDRDQCR